MGAILSAILLFGIAFKRLHEIIFSMRIIYQKFPNFTRYFFPFLIKLTFKSNIYALIFRFLIYEFCRRKKSQCEFQLLERWSACYSIRYPSSWDRVQKIVRDNILDENCIRNFQISFDIFFPFLIKVNFE